jgi:catechol 2,3-dioxygenase-like lactoylglutathione lyase family enzyme
MPVKQLIPMLSVGDVQRSLKFYQDVAGLVRTSPEEAIEEWQWARIESGSVCLMLAGNHCPVSGDEPSGLENNPAAVNFYFYPDDVVGHHKHLQQLGYEPGDLYVTFYQMKEFSLRDPDGHLLTFGQDTNDPPTPEPVK